MDRLIDILWSIGSAIEYFTSDVDNILTVSLLSKTDLSTDFSSRAVEVLNTLNEILGIVAIYASIAGPEAALVVLGFMGILSIVSEVIQYERAKTELDKLGEELDQLKGNVSSLNNALN